MEITKELLNEKIQNGDKIIVDFFASWCSPCLAMKPTFEKLSEDIRNEGSNVEMYTMDVDKNRDIAVQYGVRSVPTIKVFDGGNVIDTKVGIQSEDQLKSMVSSLSNG
jgi:thioredoxin 1